MEEAGIIVPPLRKGVSGGLSTVVACDLVIRMYMKGMCAGLSSQGNRPCLSYSAESFV